MTSKVNHFSLKRRLLIPVAELLIIFMSLLSSTASFATICSKHFITRSSLHNKFRPDAKGVLTIISTSNIGDVGWRGWRRSFSTAFSSISTSEIFTAQKQEHIPTRRGGFMNTTTSDFVSQGSSPFTKKKRS